MSYALFSPSGHKVVCLTEKDADRLKSLGYSEEKKAKKKTTRKKVKSNGN